MNTRRCKRSRGGSKTSKKTFMNDKELVNLESNSFFFKPNNFFYDCMCSTLQQLCFFCK